MGMYNEVSAPCPDCKESCMIQIPQVTLGFGEFHVDRPETVEHLSFEEKVTLKEYLEDRVFYCDRHGPFEVTIEVKDRRPKFDF